VAVLLLLVALSGVAGYFFINQGQGVEKVQSRTAWGKTEQNLSKTEQNRSAEARVENEGGNSNPISKSAEGKTSSAPATSKQSDVVPKSGVENVKQPMPDVKGQITEQKSVVHSGQPSYLLPFGIKTVQVGTDFEIPADIKGLKPVQRPTVPGRWVLGVGVVQNRAGMAYSVNPENRSYVHKNYLKRMQEGEFMAGNVQAGISLGYKLNKKWTLLSGINYAMLSNRQDFNFSDEVPVTMMPGNKPDKFGNYPIIGYFTPSVPNFTQYKGFSKISFIEVPLGLSYEHKLNRKWSLIPSATLNACRIAGETGYTLDYQLLSAVPRKSEWFRKTVFTAAASVGIYKEISPRMQWGVNLLSSRNLTPVYVPNASVNPRAWSAGMGMQILWRIDR
jgi:hypothetical protein